MKKLMILALPVMMFTACNKYEQGPDISLRTKTARVSNTWQVSSAYQNGVDRTADFNAAFAGYLLNIRKDNTYALSYSPFSIGTVSDNGHWEFNGDKTKITFTAGDGDVSTYTIIRLKEKELWVRFFDDDNKEWEVHLVPKS